MLAVVVLPLVFQVEVLAVVLQVVVLPVHFPSAVEVAVVMPAFG